MANVLLAYKNFAGPTISHVGLGVSALNLAKVMKSHGLQASVSPVQSAGDITQKIDASTTHVVISAPWLSPQDISGLLSKHPGVEFSVIVHSNVGFLQADANGVHLIRQYIDLEQGNLNFRIAANSKKGVRWLRSAYQCPCLYLPNLYFLDYSQNSRRPLWTGGTLYLGAFGAQRPLKNLMTAAGAALEIANALKADTELWISSGRAEGGGGTVIAAMKEMLSGLRNIKLVEAGWASWPQFRDIVRKMHLLISASYTESFNMVTADGMAEGVPSVTSDAIDWVPSYWQAPCDDTGEIARVGRQLLTDPNAAHDGLVALEQHNKNGFEAWGQYLGSSLPYKSLLADPFLI